MPLKLPATGLGDEKCIILWKISEFTSINQSPHLAPLLDCKISAERVNFQTIEIRDKRTGMFPMVGNWTRSRKSLQLGQQREYEANDSWKNDHSRQDLGA